MEKGGWLDQIILLVLGVLTNRWLGYAVAFFGSLAVAYLARRSPKADLAYLQEGAVYVLAGAFLVSASLRSVPRLVLPESRFVCDRSGPFRSLNCRSESVGEFRTVIDYSFLDMLRDYGLSLLQEALIGAIGALCGIGIALLVPHLAATPPDDGSAQS
jgi:hypothetical protein